MENWQQMDKPLRDLIEIIHFTESVAAEIHGLLDEADIFRTVAEEFAQSKRYTASILLLTDDGSSLRIAETALPPEKVEAGEKAAGVRLKGYKIDLNKSRIYRQVVREGKTLQVNVSDVISELFPRPLAYLISKTLGYEKKPSMDILEKEVATSERIISSLLGFARPKPPIRRKVDINQVVQEALSRTTLPENVEVVSELDETLPTILADPDQLAQVFGNILLNAVQAMPEGGRLVIQTSEVSERLPKSEWVAISFTDTGVGISAENLKKLFEPLFTTRAKGIGLGLPLVKTLVEGHGGTIEVESEVGKGSTFTVKLPVA